MVKTAANPLGLPKQVFDDLQAQLAANRSQFYRDVPAGPFYGYNRSGAKVSETVMQNWWRQGMMGGAKAHYDGIVAFSQTDFTEDLKKITVPVLNDRGGSMGRADGPAYVASEKNWTAPDRYIFFDSDRQILSSRLSVDPIFIGLESRLVQHAPVH
jgi:hypothetical protein